MIDNFAILLSTAMIVYVIARAARLNKTLPWFERVADRHAASKQAAVKPSRLTGLQRSLKS